VSLENKSSSFISNLLESIRIGHSRGVNALIKDESPEAEELLAR